MSGHNRSPQRRNDRGRSTGGEESLLNASARQLDAFSRKVTATAGHLIGPALGEGSIAQHYQNALNDIHRELRHPLVQRNVFSLSQLSPKEILRSKLSTNEIQHRALTYIPDDVLLDVPKTNNAFSLFQGFQATLPEPADTGKRKERGRRPSRGRKLIGSKDDERDTPPDMAKLKHEKDGLTHRLEMLTVRKNMCSTEIHEIDSKIANLNTMRKIVLDRLAGLEQEEVQLENDMLDVETKIEEMQEELDDEAALAQARRATTPPPPVDTPREETPDIVSIDSPITDDTNFMSQSIYEKIPTPKTKRTRPMRRKSNFILHEHLQAGSQIREFQAHTDIITALDFDVPFGTMVTSALDDTVRVWDLNAGRCIGMLEGHLSSVRCLQVEDSIVATGGMDASVRLWDLSQAEYAPRVDSRINKDRSSPTTDLEDEDDGFSFADHPPAAASSMADCEVFNLSSHVAEVTALHFHNNTLISGSADKTLRQWDLEKGRCVQTMDVMWAAAQAAINVNPTSSSSSSGANLFGGDASYAWRQPGRAPDASADFVGALQCFDAALACGTADGMVRLWDLRSGQVHRSLVGHTGPVTCLQFDDVHLVTGSLDRSIRIWDLRTGTIYDAFAYDNPITSMMFDARRIVAAAGEPVVKVYDKTDGRQWDCGTGAVGGKGGGLNIVGDHTVDEAHETTGVAAVEEEEGYIPAKRGSAAIVEKVRIKDGFMVEGRRDGMIGVWSC